MEGGDPSTRKILMTKIIILEGKTNFCLVYMQKLSVGVVARNHIKLLVFSG